MWAKRGDGDSKKAPKRRRRRKRAGPDDSQLALPQCYVLPGVRSERQKVIENGGLATALVGWQQRVWTNQNKFVAKNTAALERGKKYNEFLLKQTQERERLHLLAGQAMLKRSGLHLRRPLADFVSANDGASTFVEIMTSHPRKYTLGQHFDSILSDGTHLAGTVVGIQKDKQEQTSILSVQRDRPADAREQQLGAYDLETRVKSIQALDKDFQACIAIMRNDQVCDKIADLKTYLEKRPIYLSPREKNELESNQQLVTGLKNDRAIACDHGGHNAAQKILRPRKQSAILARGLHETRQEVDNASIRVRDAEILEELSRRYGALADNLFIGNDLPGKAYLFRVNFASRIITGFLRYHSGRRTFLRNFLVLKLQSAFRSKQARRLAEKLQAQKHMMWFSFQKKQDRIFKRCFKAWIIYTLEQKQIKRKVKRMLNERVLLLFEEWRKVHSQRMKIHESLRKRREWRIRRKLVGLWAENTAKQKKKRAFQTASQLRYKSIYFNRWADKTALTILKKIDAMHYGAEQLQRLWRGHAVRKRQRARLKVALFIQRWRIGNLVRFEYNRPFGIKERQKRLRAKRIKKQHLRNIITKSHRDKQEKQKKRLL